MSETSGVKFLILGRAGAGKTTLLKDLKDAVVFSYDNKDFPISNGNILHRNMHHAKNGGSIVSADDFRSRLKDLLDAYKNAKGEYPKTLVIDSISTVAGSLYDKWDTGLSEKEKANSFKKFEMYKVGINGVNDIINNIIANMGINVVLITHAKYNAETGYWEDTTVGSFSKTDGGFYGTVDNSIFVEVTGNDRLIHLKNSYKLARTVLDLDYTEVYAKDYNLQEHLEQIIEHSKKSSEFAI